MKDQPQPSKTFEERIESYYQNLHINYEQAVSEAANKEYAIAYYKQLLSDQLDLIPIGSFFFYQLQTKYIHLYMLHGSTALKQLMTLISGLREEGFEVYEAGMMEVTNPGQRYQLPLHYQIKLAEGRSLSEILSNEHKVLHLTDDELFELLAFSLALSKLTLELNSTSVEVVPQLTYKTPTNSFTRSQQVLVYHYLLVASGVKPRAGANITDCAILLHQFIGLPVSDIANSDLYKKLKKPIDHASPSKMIQNLQVIRPYFESMPHKMVLELIDKDLKALLNGMNA